MQEFRDTFYNFDTIEEHMEHIGQLVARGIWNDDFVEGYGKPSDLGIEVEIINSETWVED